MSPPAETPRFAIVIAPAPVTAPEVRKARVENVLGLIAALTAMFPLFVPPKSPIRKVDAEILATSAATSERLPAVSVPKLTGVVEVVGATVTTPLVAEIVFAVLIASELALMKTYEFEAAVMLPFIAMFPP
jgi:hypothetical protein